MNRYAVLIANGEYTEASGFTQLDTPQNDIARLRETLSDKTRGSLEVTSVLNETTDGSCNAIVKALERAGPDDLLLIYFSGHGIIGKDGRLYLAAENSQRDHDLTMLPFASVAKGVQHDDCLRSVVILDCCFSGSAGVEMKGDAIGTVVEKEGYNSQLECKGVASPCDFDENTCGTGRFLMTACSALQ